MSGEEKDYYKSIAGVTLNKGIDILQDNLKEKEEEVRKLRKKVKNLEESNQYFALKNLKLKDKNHKASKIIADLKRQEKIEDVVALEEEVIRLIKENKRLENKLEHIKELL